MLTTKQVLITGPGKVETRRRQLAPLRAGQALLRVTQCGVCASEVDQWLGKADRYPVEIGHEVAGVVEEIAPEEDGGDGYRGDGYGDDEYGGDGYGGSLKPGDQVASWVPGGGYTEFMVIEARHAVPVRPGSPFPAVAEPLACCVNAVELAAPRMGADVVIIGTGFISRLVQRLSVLKGARSVIVAGRRPEPLSEALGRGATRVVNLRTESLAEAVAETTGADGANGADGADVVYEATGAEDALALAGQVTRTGGTLAIVGYHQGGPRTIDIARWNERALRIANAHFRDLDTILSGMRTAVALVDSGRLDPSDLLTHRYSLDDAPTAFRTAAARPEGFVKAVVEPRPYTAL